VRLGPWPKSAHKRKPKKDTGLMDALVTAQAKEAGWEPPVKEYRYVPNRKFRADYAWESRKVLLEIQGGIFNRKAHGSITGLLADLERGNHASANGWYLFRLTPDQVRKGELRGWLARHNATRPPTKPQEPLLQVWTSITAQDLAKIQHTPTTLIHAAPHK